MTENPEDAAAPDALGQAAAAGEHEEEAEGPFGLFLDGLRVTDPDLEGLEGPASEERIAAAEDALGTQLPPSFRRFLRLHDGGLAFEATILGVSEDEGELVITNERIRDEGHPRELVAFASSSGGDLYCFDTTLRDDAGECPVVLVDIEEGEGLSVCASFAAWLERLPSLEHEMADARGPQPMSIEEWESFVIREREKLRRLAQTPARELRMPDPEKVRADLGGKIPVDPRHLKPRE